MEQHSADQLTSPLVQVLAPRTVRGPKTSATLGKPLIREFLFYRSGKLLSKSSGSGLCVAQEPHLPRNRAYCNVSTTNVQTNVPMPVSACQGTIYSKIGFIKPTCRSQR
jgi:hypothetical protein